MQQDWGPMLALLLSYYNELRNAAQMVVGEQVRARQALGNLYPDLVA